jgi:hypothetical protein
MEQVYFKFIRIFASVPLKVTDVSKNKQMQNND